MWRVPILLMSLAMTSSCSPALSQALLGVKWVHSYEEDTDSIRVYRKDTYDFPPSRGRYAFHLKPDGTYEAFNIGKTDKIEPATGHWKTIDESTFEVSFPGEPDKNFRLKILERDAKRITCQVKHR